MKASGKNGDRPAFTKLFEHASRKEFDLVLFWWLDRFSHKGVLETLQHLQRLTSHGVDWFSYREEYLRRPPVPRRRPRDPCGYAKQERVRISEGVQAGLNRARAGKETWQAERGGQTRSGPGAAAAVYGCVDTLQRENSNPCATMYCRFGSSDPPTITNVRNVQNVLNVQNEAREGRVEAALNRQHHGPADRAVWYLILTKCCYPDRR